MARQIILQILRAPDLATRETLTPEEGEFIYQMDTNALYIGDGTTAGGNFLALIGSTAPITDAINIGAGGVGLFKQVNDTTLEFKNINASSTKVIITSDSPNDEVDIDIDPAEILTSALNNDGGFLDETSHDSLPQDNPHNITKAQVGLGNADNTSDLDKPISTATQTALGLKYNASNPNGYETPIQLNTRDLNNRARANHTGTQLASTISNLDTFIANYFDRQYTENLITMTTTNITPPGVSYLLTTKNILNNALYKIDYYFRFGINSYQAPIIVGFYLGGSLIQEFPLNTLDFSTPDPEHPHMFRTFQTLTPGNTDLEIKFRASNGFYSVTLHEAKISLERWD